MRNLWLFPLFACAALAQIKGKAPQSGIEPVQYFPPLEPGQSLPRRAAFPNPDPQGTCGNEVNCHGGCIPPNFTCCLSGGFCPSTYYCDSDNGCCEQGKKCSGTPFGCPDGTKYCGFVCIPNVDQCSNAGVPTLVPTLVPTVVPTVVPTLTGSGSTSTSVPQSGPVGYTTTDGTCVSGFKLCGTYWCIENNVACCNSGEFSCAAGAHCTPTACAYTCTAGEKQCGRICITSDRDCCGDDGTSCDAGAYCSGALCYQQPTRTLIVNT